MNQPLPVSALANTAEIFLGRQPILDHKKQIIAFELLFRSKASLDDADVSDDLLATSTVIVNTLSQFGLEQVLGNKLGFLNVSASLLLSETVNLLPPERIVLEILEDVPINAQIIARCQQLKDMGFRLALDDFEYRSEYDALFPLIDYVKIDLTITPVAKLPEIIKFLRKVTSAKLIAEKVEEINKKYGEKTAEIEIKQQYLNMKKQFEGKMHIVDIAEQAMKDSGIEPKIKAIRGGTDGAQLSYMGLPCPNIFAGGHNFHGPYEFVPLESMLAAVKVIANIAQSVKIKV